MRKTDSLAFILLLPLILMGCNHHSDTNQAEVDQGAAAEEVAVPQQPPELSKLSWKIVDRNKALAENPNLVEVENDTEASDPLTAIMQARHSATSRINKLTMEHNAKLQSFVNATEGAGDPKPLTFKEFNAAAQLNKNNVKGLYEWQAYAYDETTGKVTILEDPAEKKRIQEARQK